MFSSLHNSSGNKLLPRVFFVLTGAKLSMPKRYSSKPRAPRTKKGQAFVDEERFGRLKEGEGKNPFYVGLVSRFRIQDGYLKRFLLVLFFPIQLILFLSAAYSYGSLFAVLYASFGILEGLSGQRRRAGHVITNKKFKSKRRSRAQTRESLTLVCISDTHMRHKYFDDTFPNGDVLVHTGDASNFGSFDELKEFALWFAQQPHKYKIFVPGNHDMLFDEKFYDVYYKEWTIGKKESSLKIKQLMAKLGIIVLIDESIVIENIKFYGTPWTIIEHPWQTAFQLPADKMVTKWEHIEEDTDILLTHSPPYGILDKCLFGGSNTGCKELMRVVKEKIKPAVHVYGHEHGEPGIQQHIYQSGQCTYFGNAASVSEYYITRRNPLVFSITLS